MLKEKIMLANKEIEKVYYYIEENNQMFDMMNLKLHNASYYSYSELGSDFPLLENKADDLFYKFASISYDDFLSDLYEIKGIRFNDIKEEVGRTSSFYLKADDIRVENMNITTITDILYNDYGYTVLEDYVTILDSKYLYEVDLSDIDVENREQELEVLEQELDYIIESLFDGFKRAIEDVEYTYIYIKSFKDNQVDNFKCFLEQEEVAEYEENKVAEKVEQRRKQIRDIKFKYNIDTKDMDILKEAIGYIE